MTSWSGYVGFREKTPNNFTESLFDFGVFTVNKLISRHNNLFGSNMAIRKSIWLLVRDDVRDSMDYWEDLEIASALSAIGVDSVVSKQKLIDISYRGGRTSASRFHHRMLGGIRTYWKRNKPAAIFGAPWAYLALVLVTLWRLATAPFQR